jgi:hypothetical protein
MEAGSPPCSPQMPIFMSAFTARHARCNPDQFADAVLVKRHERILFHHAKALIGAKELAGIIARNAEGGLRQVVGAEGEELRRAAISRRAGRARQFDHRADRVIDVAPFSLITACFADRCRLDEIELRTVATSGTITSGSTGLAGLLLGSMAASKIARACISGDFGIGDRKAAAAMAEHRVELVQLGHTRSAAIRADAEIGGNRLHFLVGAAGIHAAADRAGGSSPAGRP